MKGVFADHTNETVSPPPALKHTLAATAACSRNIRIQNLRSDRDRGQLKEGSARRRMTKMEHESANDEPITLQAPQR